MPGMDGETAAKSIISDYPVEQRPIIIALTANAMPEDKERYLSIGMNDYLCKPVMPENIKAVISKWGSRIADFKQADQQENPELDEIPVLDSSVIDSIFKINIELLNKLTDIYYRETSTITEKLKEFLQKDNMQKVIDTAHKYKGMSINIGANLISEICKKIEAAARDNQRDNIKTCIESLEPTIKTTRQQFELLKKEL